MLRMKISEQVDIFLIKFAKTLALPLSRFSLFVVFFWFGFLKIVGESPANLLVNNLLQETLPFVSFEQFILFFGLYEMAIGVIFLWPKGNRVAIALLFPHMITTFLPLLLLPSITWSRFFVPTLEGQYIIKNLVIISLAIFIASFTKPHRR